MSMIKHVILATSLSIVSLFSSAWATQQTSPSFSPGQKKEIQTIIHDYLISHPEILIETAKQLQKQQMEKMNEKAVGAIKANRAQIFSASSSPIAGNPQGTVTIVEFFDYQCPHCKEVAKMISTLLKNNPNVKIVFKELPIFPGSEAISLAALASMQQGKYFEFHNALLNAPDPISQNDVMSIASKLKINVEQLKKDMNNAALKDELKKNIQLANALGLPGTPTFIVAANVHSDQQLYPIYIPGMVNASVLQAAIKNAMQHIVKTQ